VPDPVIGLQVVDLDALRELAWSGVPSDLRPTCWQLLLGYLPPNRERRCDTAGGPAFSLACPSVSVSALTFPGMAKASNSTRPDFYNLARASRLGRRVGIQMSYDRIYVILAKAYAWSEDQEDSDVVCLCRQTDT